MTLLKQTNRKPKMNALPNFKASVPVDLQTKIKAFADSVDMSEITKGYRFESHSEQRTDEIEGNYVSGWMPKQDGGFAIGQFFENDCDSGNFTDKQKEFNDEQYEQCKEQFFSDNDIDPNTDWDDLPEDKQQEFFDYEREWFDSALLQVEIFADGYGEFSREPEKTVCIRLSINYKDAPYYREGYAEDIKQIILSIDEFMAQDNAEILKQITI